MTQDFLDSLQRSNSMTWILGQKSFDQTLDLLRDIDHFGELGFRMKNGIEDIFLFRCIEGRSSKEKFVEQYTQSIKVN